MNADQKTRRWLGRGRGGEFAFAGFGDFGFDPFAGRAVGGEDEEEFTSGGGWPRRFARGFFGRGTWRAGRASIGRRRRQERICAARLTPG